MEELDCGLGQIRGVRETRLPVHFAQFYILLSYLPLVKDMVCVLAVIFFKALQKHHVQQSPELLDGLKKLEF